MSRYVTPCEEDIQRQILTPSGPFASMHYAPCVINIKTRWSSGQTILSSSITVSISHCIVFCERNNYQVMCLRTRIRRIFLTCGPVVHEKLQTQTDADPIQFYCAEFYF